RAVANLTPAANRAHQQSCRYTAVRFSSVLPDVVFMSESATGTEPSAKTLLRRAAGAARLDNALSTLLGLVQVAATIVLALWVARTLENAIYQPQPLLPDLTGGLQLAGILLLRTRAVYAQTLTGNRASLAIRNALREQA